MNPIQLNRLVCDLSDELQKPNQLCEPTRNALLNALKAANRELVYTPEERRKMIKTQIANLQNELLLC